MSKETEQGVAPGDKGRPLPFFTPSAERLPTHIVNRDDVFSKVLQGLTYLAKEKKDAL